ncbi:MAG: hypothetical protein O3A47_11075 [Chloroflexi bacterium]|nr:hypothetical protein [Chloroflexota bacterium]
MFAGAPKTPPYCFPSETGTLQEVERTPASPYFVHHPKADSTDPPTVIFLPGGSGSRRSAQRVWSNYLSEGVGVEAFRLVVPYSLDEVGSETQTVLAVLDEVLACYGGGAAKVHLAGVSNGGLAAFAVMLRHAERFATLLGAPGLFRIDDPAKWANAMGGRAVFNGVGANDDGWMPDVKAMHDGLLAEGVESVYVEFAGEGHTVGAEFDESVFFRFWTEH